VTTVKFISEKRAREIIEAEVKSNRDRGHIVNPSGFSEHCIRTGRIAHEVALKILKRHPSLSNKIHPDILRVEGYMHDLSKIYEGDKYHEVGTAHLILTQGATNLGLVCEGSQFEKREILTAMAHIVLPDAALYEELGKDWFPENALYKDRIDAFVDRVHFLRAELSKTDEPLRMEEFALPFTLNQFIALYADLTHVDGRKVSVEEKTELLIERYNDPQGGYYNPILARLDKEILPRRLMVERVVESLMQ
jgi:hypothetical protein